MRHLRDVYKLNHTEFLKKYLYEPKKIVKDLSHKRYDGLASIISASSQLQNLSRQIRETLGGERGVELAKEGKQSAEGGLTLRARLESLNQV